MGDQPRLDWATHESAKFACEKWHYSGCMPAGKTIKIGVWEHERFIGVVVFSRGANKTLGAPYGLTQSEVCELSRVALTAHDSTVSKIIKIARLLLTRKCPGLRLIVSFADTEQGHNGAIYQADNWIYTGLTTAADEYLVGTKRLHGRSMRAKYGTHTDKAFIQKITGSRKHRYLYPLDRETRKLIRHKGIDYPSRDKQAMAGANQHSGGAAPTVTLQEFA